MTDEAHDEQRARIEQLQRRRSAGVSPAPSEGSVRGTRSRPAQGSRVAAAGFGVASMLGLVAAMGFANRASASTPPAPAATVPAPVVLVVVHPAEGTTNSAQTSTAPAVGASTPATPVVLSAQPTVRQAPPASSAPTAQTNGSR